MLEKNEDIIMSVLDTANKNGYKILRKIKHAQRVNLKHVISVA